MNQFKLTSAHLAVYKMIQSRGVGGACNDLNPDEEQLLTKEEWKEFLEAYHDWNGDPETFAERTYFVPMDFMVVNFIQHILIESYEKYIYDQERL